MVKVNPIDIHIYCKHVEAVVLSVLSQLTRENSEVAVVTCHTQSLLSLDG